MDLLSVLLENRTQLLSYSITQLLSFILPVYFFLYR